MNRLVLHTFTLCAMIASLQGCANPDRLIVYADPWLAEFADSMITRFQATHTETEVQLKILSSEVIVQHVRFGQPVDVMLCFGCEWYQQADFRSQMEQEQTLAASRVVLLARLDSLPSAKERTMKTESAVMLEASDRPARLYADAAGLTGSVPPESLLIANFQRQATDYLLREWVSRGFLPIHFARKHANRFRIAEQGPLITNAFTAILMKNAPHPALADDFFDLVNSEKSKAMLAQLRFLP